MPEMNFYSEDVSGRAALPQVAGHKGNEHRPANDHAEQVTGDDSAKYDTTLGDWLDKRDLPWLVPMILCFVIMGIVEVLG